MGEPTDVMCESIMQDAAKTGCKRIIAIGGGTVIDIAKALAVATEDASMDSLYSVMPALTRKYELVIIPTTCGTGSEVTNIAVFNRTRMGTKMGLVGEAMYADKAVLFPKLLSGLPFVFLPQVLSMHWFTLLSPACLPMPHPTPNSSATRL